jgi:uncharacterized protein YihD (DUF1040 family)
MRDPERIPEMLEVLRAAWEAHPDLRLGQLLWNLREENPHLTYVVNMFYNMEDDVLESRMRAQYLETTEPTLAR